MGGQRYERRLVTLLFFAWGFVFLDRLAITFLFPTIAPEIHLSNANLGTINLWQVVGYAASAIIFGMISDKTGYRKKWLVIFVFAASLFSALSAASGSFETLVFFRFLTGASEGPVLPIAMSMLSMQGNPKKFGRNSGIVNAGVSVLASTIGPIIVTQLVVHFNWHMAFILSSIPSFLLAIFLIKFSKEIDPSEIKEQETIKWKDFVKVIKYRNVVLNLLISILAMGGYWIMLTFAPLYWVEVGHLSNQTMGLLSSGTGLIGIFWCIAVPYIADHIGRKTTLIIFCFLSIIPLAVLYFFQGGWISVAAYVLLTGVMGGMFPLYMTIIPMETVPKHLAATANALIMGAGELIGGAIVPRVAGSFADMYGLGMVMICGAIGFFIAALVGFGLIETKPKAVKVSADIVNQPNT
ncbi:MFS transporter [Scopulibacillus cellulosilyticus]|uniref:MFS transporter n=1 Tax=Scopulibacillus cellulosilyticus TaxID=2665665 RepID=A0ABW2PU84_9BACL